MMLISTVYDSAFYYTSEEIKQKGVDIDVQTIVEMPEIHILARSGSSLHDQRMFNECRRQSLTKFSSTIYTQKGIPIKDNIRFFHGDGPAQQFEAGNKVGGYYSCVGCDACSTRFDDISYCFRAKPVTLQDRQDFI